MEYKRQYRHSEIVLKAMQAKKRYRKSKSKRQKKRNKPTTHHFITIY